MSRRGRRPGSTACLSSSLMHSIDTNKCSDDNSASKPYVELPLHTTPLGDVAAEPAHQRYLRSVGSRPSSVGTLPPHLVRAVARGEAARGLRDGAGRRPREVCGAALGDGRARFTSGGVAQAIVHELGDGLRAHACGGIHDSAHKVGCGRTAHKIAAARDKWVQRHRSGEGIVSNIETVSISFLPSFLKNLPYRQIT